MVNTVNDRKSPQTGGPKAPSRGGLGGVFSDEWIGIEALRVECIIGVRAREREIPQPLVVDLGFLADFSAAAASENLADTVSYSEVAAFSRQFIVAGKYGLLETLARDLAQAVGERFGLKRLGLYIRKPQAVSESEGASVRLKWTAS